MAHSPPSQLPNESVCAPEDHTHPPRPATPISEATFERAAAIFRAAGDVSRLRLLERLSQGEWCVSELAEAYLQPYGTTFFQGASLREQAVDWLQTDRSAGGLVALTQGEAFWQKLALYLFHYTALVAGLVGIWRTRRRWQVGLPMLGVIAYFTLVHLVLYAQPRYLFPMEVFWWVFAAAAFFPPRESEGEFGR